MIDILVIVDDFHVIVEKSDSFETYVVQIPM